MIRRARPILLMAYLLAAGTPSTTIAHGGGLDSLGCHYNRKTGGFHCHQGPLAGQDFRSELEALEVVQRVEEARANLAQLRSQGSGDTLDEDTQAQILQLEEYIAQYSKQAERAITAGSGGQSR